MMTHILLLIGILVLVVAIVNFVNFSMALAPSRIKSLNTQKHSVLVIVFCVGALFPKQ